MEPKIVSKPAFTVVGIKHHGKNEHGEIPQLWGAFVPRMGEIRHVAKQHVSYGVMGNYDEATGEFDYVAGLEVDSAAGIPEGMVSWQVPAQQYAVFTCTLPTIGSVFDYAYKTWLPQSSHTHALGPEFELYDERFNPEDPSSEMDIYIPIQ